MKHRAISTRLFGARSACFYVLKTLPLETPVAKIVRHFPNWKRKTYSKGLIQWHNLLHLTCTWLCDVGVENGAFANEYEPIRDVVWQPRNSLTVGYEKALSKICENKGRRSFVIEMGCATSKTHCGGVMCQFDTVRHYGGTYWEIDIYIVSKR